MMEINQKPPLDLDKLSRGADALSALHDKAKKIAQAEIDTILTPDNLLKLSEYSFEITGDIVSIFLEPIPVKGNKLLFTKIKDKAWKQHSTAPQNGVQYRIFYKNIWVRE